MPEIYCITNLINGKEYVGQTKYDAQYRFKQHCEKSVNVNSKFQCHALYNAIRKYGRESFMVMTIFQGTLEELDDNEIEAIDFLNTLYPNGYNMTPGGHVRTGKWLREESKEKLSESKRIHHNYNLPRHISEICNEYKQGFRVSMNYNTIVYEFTSPFMSMTMKLSRALECLDTLKKGNAYVPLSAIWKRKYNDIQLPKYITYQESAGFRVQKPGFTNMIFSDEHISLDDNLVLAMTYLNSCI